MAQGRSFKIIPMMKWIRTRRMSIKNSLFLEAWSFYRTISGVRLCWSSKNLKDLEGGVQDGCPGGQEDEIMWTG